MITKRDVIMIALRLICPPDVGDCSAYVGDGDFMNAQKGTSTADAQL